jgi:hypothetical protein
MTQTKVGQFNVENRVLNGIREASQKTGANFKLMLAKAAQESGFDPEARARGSSAQGLYQFIDSTWLGVLKRHGDRHGYGHLSEAISTAVDGTHRVADPDLRMRILDLRRDPRANALMGGEFTRENERHLEGAFGVPPSPTDLHLAHFLGPQGAERFIRRMRSDPDANASIEFRQAAQSNPAIFTDRSSGRERTYREVYGLFDRITKSKMEMAGDVSPAIGPRRPTPRGIPGLVDWERSVALLQVSEPPASPAKTGSSTAAGVAGISEGRRGMDVRDYLQDRYSILTNSGLRPKTAPVQRT